MQHYPNPANPYAAPVAVSAPQVPGGLGPAMGWEIGEVISQAWDIFKQQWPVLLFAPIVVWLIGFVTGFVLQLPVGLVVEESAEAGIALGIVVAIVQILISVYFQVGMTRLYITAARSQPADFGLVFSGAKGMFAWLLGGILIAPVLLLGYALLIVPGVILSLGWAFMGHFIADRNMGPIEALKASWGATNGHKLQLFLFGLVAFCIMILGVLACGVGMLVALPIVSVAMAIIYTRLSGTAVAPPPALMPQTAYPGAGYPPPGAPGGQAPMGGYNPPGGYGPPGGQGPQGGGFGGPQGGGFGGPPGGGYGPHGGGGYGPPPGGGSPGGGYPPPGGGYGQR